FEASRMSFGDHLDALRSAMIKAILAITVGFLIGLLGGRQFVQFVTEPLEKAVKEHQLERAKGRYLETLKERREQGERLPEDDEELALLADSFVDSGLAPRKVFIDPQQLEGVNRVPELGDLREITIFEPTDNARDQIIATDVK